MPNTEYTRVYTYTGTRAHLLSPVSGIRHGYVLCGMTPGYPWEWLGTGTQKERDKAASLPVCKRCTERVSDKGQI